MKILSAVWLSFSITIAMAQPMLVKDINNEANAQSEGSVAGNERAIEFKGKMYFSASSDIYGHEMFVSDGTEEGTSILKDIYPGQKGFGANVYMGALADVLLFAFEGEDGYALWRTDGTEEGTVKIASVQTLSNNGYFTVLDNIAYFSGDDGEHGFEPWRSDGTTEGTFMLKDIAEGETSSWANVIVATQNKIFFAAGDSDHGNELWTTDGTTDGTNIVMDINPGNSSTRIQALIPDGDLVYFNANNGTTASSLWKSDGTEAGTVAIPGASGVGVDKIILVGNKIVYNNSHASDGADWYSFDLDTEQSQLLKDFTVTHTTSGYVGTPVLFDDHVWFFVELDYPTSYSLWKTDGTLENTEQVLETDRSPYDYPYFDLIPVADKLVLSIAQNLDVVDDEQVLTIHSGSETQGAFPFGDRIFLFMYEPWISDGTAAGTKQITDLNQNRDLGYWNLLNTNGHIVFMNNYIADNNSINDLWASDGTSDGTEKIHSFAFAMSGDVPNDGHKLFFNAANKSSNQNMWTTDGTANGTVPVKDGTWYSDIYGTGRFQRVGNTTFIFSQSKQLWKTDGTSGGTVKVADMPSYLDDVFYHVAFKQSAYFFNWGQLWKSDGTEAGTSMLADVNFPGIGIYNPVNGFMSGDNKMFFVAYTEDNGWEVWSSNGSVGGTHLIKDISSLNDPDAFMYHPTLLTVVNDLAYFTASSGKDDIELWRTDGTAEGTYLVKDINPGPSASRIAFYTAVENTIYFSATDGVHGQELWKSDGTEAGTVMLKDVYPGIMSSQLSDTGPTAVIDGTLYFAANDGTHGYELWKTDGTTEGTSLEADVYTGILNGVNYGSMSMTSIGSKIYFVGMDAEHGRELWVYDVDDNTDPTDPTDPTNPTEPTDPTTGLNDKLNDLVVYPNPATNNIMINSPSNFRSATLRDMLGQSVLAITLDQKETTIDVSHLPRGIYLVQLKLNDQTSIVKKIILK